VLAQPRSGLARGGGRERLRRSARLLRRRHRLGRRRLGRRREPARVLVAHAMAAQLLHQRVELGGVEQRRQRRRV